MYTGTGDGRWDPENGVYGNGIIGVKQNPETKSLDLVDYYGPSNADWLVKRDLDMQVTPAIFHYKGKEYMVDASKECRLYFMDTESIGGDDHRTPLYRTPLICNEMVDFAEAGIWGSLASWEMAKARWSRRCLGAEAFPVQSTERMASSRRARSWHSKWSRRMERCSFRQPGFPATWTRPSHP
jgi:hypothetical protein